MENHCIYLTDSEIEELVTSRFNTIMSFKCFNYENHVQITGIMFSDDAPSEGDIIPLDNGYRVTVELSIDHTDDEDMEQGLSYNKIKFTLEHPKDHDMLFAEANTNAYNMPLSETLND